MTAQIGVVGLAVMGENLALNIANHSFTVAVFNRTVAKVDHFASGRGNLPNVIPTHSQQEFASALQRPRKAILLVQAGNAVDSTIEGLLPHFEAGDIIIDGGNSHYKDTERRYKELKEKGILFVGCGVSGGEEGALNGPSLMPGGAIEAWEHLKPIFQAISAKAKDGSPCCEWIGEGGSGHYVKMVHNGIEYGDMQLIAEGYFLLKNLLGLTNQDLYHVFDEWNQGVMDSFLVEISRDIVIKEDDEEPGSYILDKILDSAGQKGTGKWTAINALDVGMPLTLIGEAVFARCLSSQKDERVRAASILSGPPQSLVEGDKKQWIQDIHNALYAAKIVSYAQGFVLLQAAAKEFNWKLNYGEIASIWRAGCIIRSKFLSNIKEAFDRNNHLENLMLDPFFTGEISTAQSGWRKAAAAALLHGIPAPAITTALSYYDGYRTATGSANLIQAQRDYFGAHTFQRIDKEKGIVFHCNWTGHGGSTTSGSYNA